MKRADFTSCQTTIHQQQCRLILPWEISPMKSLIPESQNKATNANSASNHRKVRLYIMT